MRPQKSRDIGGRCPYNTPQAAGGDIRFIEGHQARPATPAADALGHLLGGVPAELARRIRSFGRLSCDTFLYSHLRFGLARKPPSGDRLTEQQSHNARHSKPVIGLAGGVGAGKTAVARLLADLGAGVVDSDGLGRQEISRPEVKKKLCEWWGSGVLSENGDVDRRKVATIVFADPEQRRRLEALLHPRIAARREEALAEFNAKPEIKAIVIDSPLLFESDLDLQCDAVIFVHADVDIRMARSEKHRNWTAEEFHRREKSQLPLDTKRARADYVCRNNSTLSALRIEIAGILAQVVSNAGPA